MGRHAKAQTPKPKRPKTGLGLPDLDHSKSAVYGGAKSTDYAVSSIPGWASDAHSGFDTSRMAIAFGHRQHCQSGSSTSPTCRQPVQVIFVPERTDSTPDGYIHPVHGVFAVRGVLSRAKWFGHAPSNCEMN